LETDVISEVNQFEINGQNEKGKWFRKRNQLDRQEVLKSVQEGNLVIQEEIPRWIPDIKKPQRYWRQFDRIKREKGHYPNQFVIDPKVGPARKLQSGQRARQGPKETSNTLLWTRNGSSNERDAEGVLNWSCRIQKSKEYEALRDNSLFRIVQEIFRCYQKLRRKSKIKRGYSSMKFQLKVDFDMKVT
jgi:hypothetical protein